MRTFKVPFTVSLMGVAVVEAETYEEARAVAERLVLAFWKSDPVDWAFGMNVETADEEPKSGDGDA